VKFAISALFYVGSTTLKRMRAMVHSDVPGTCVVLCYHSVSAEDRARFSSHMDEVRRWTIPIPADNRQALILGKRYSVITIDDGFQCAIENAIPELVQRNIPVTIFVSPDLFGTTPKWMTSDGEELSGERVVSAEKLRKCASDLVTIGSHTLTHPWLPSLAEGDAHTELFESREKLRTLLNKDAELLSFPYGASTERIVKQCRDIGYRRVFTTTPTLAFSDPEEFVTGRLRVDPSDWPLEFRLKLLGAYRWLPTAFEWKKKLQRRGLMHQPRPEALRKSEV